MEASANQYTEPMRTHVGPRSSFWRKEVQEPSTETPTQAPYDTIEARIGHLLMFGKINAVEALEMFDED